MCQHVPSGDHLGRLISQTICYGQLLIAQHAALDAEFCLSFHSGKNSSLNCTIKRLISVLDRQGRKAIEERQKKFLQQICPGAVQNVASTEELQERFTSGMAGIANACHFFLGNRPYDLDFSQIWMTTKHGVVRDINFSRRFFLREMPGLEDFAA